MPGQSNPWTLEEGFVNHLLQKYHNQADGHDPGLSSAQIRAIFIKIFPNSNRSYSNLRDNWTQRHKPSKGAIYRERIDIDHATYSAEEAGCYNWAKGWIEHYMNTDHPGIVAIPALPVPPGPGTAPTHLPAPPAPVNPVPPAPAAAPPAVAPVPPALPLPVIGTAVALPVSGPHASAPTTVPPSAPTAQGYALDNIEDSDDEDDDVYDQDAAIHAALQYEGGDVLNDHYTRQKYKLRRADHIARIGGPRAKYEMASANGNAAVIFLPGDAELSVQEIRRRELREEFEDLTPLPTKGNTQTVNNHGGYGNDEWRPAT